MDCRKASLNPCSLESIPEPIELVDGSRVWAVMLSCYQLEERNGSRQGQMDLHFVDVPDIAGSNMPTMPLRLGEPHSILDPANSSGILDGKWSCLPTTTIANRSWCFASAHSTGEIRVHLFEVSPATGEGLETAPLYRYRYLGESDRPDSRNGVAPLCLSLSWNSASAYKQNSSHRDSAQIISTYSNGTVALHDVSYLSGSIHFIERDSWNAHSMFTSPAEVWSACFRGRNDVFSGGDEGKLKLWDTRSTDRPMQVLKLFEAGVTCVSPHPDEEYMVACGSYDETICLFDVRYMNQNKKNSLLHTKKLGGGIWRIKWHPYSSNRMLIGAMHGGASVLNIGGMRKLLSQREAAPLQPSIYDALDIEISARVSKKFTEHESMVYGADWLVCQHPTRDGYFEAAATCSFYDRSVFIWDPA
jgi:diphthine methyl ester acylhydrolase